MNEIERYIQFAIDNGYREEDFWKEQENCLWKFDYLEIDIQLYHIDRFWDEHITIQQNIIACITSKPFIEAVARGINKEEFRIEVLIEQITTEQAIAIRDNKLDTFITNLLWTKWKT